MIKNHFKIAFRNLSRNKTFATINIFGLAIGIATCLLILLFVQSELGYDRFNEKADRIVRVVFRGSIQGQQMKEASVMPPTAATLKKDYPEVLEATRLRNYGYPRISFGEKTFNENAFAYVDSNFFQVFTLPFLKGNPKTALIQPNCIVISERMAQKYFGKEDPIGKVLVFKDQNISYQITGLMKDIPENSHFHFDIFASMASLPESRDPSWMTSEFYTYLVLPRHYDYKKLEAKLPQVVEKYMGPQLQKAFGMSLEQFRQKGNDIGLFLQPLTDIHLRSDLNLELEAGSDIRYVYIFSAIALFMLVIACINFMNLSTAGASKRAREVGIRKVLGSLKSDLVKQFLFESILLTTIALLLALCIVYWSVPFFNQLSGKNLSLRGILMNPWLVPGLLLVGLFTGFLAGGYPAFYLSSFQPATVLKGKFSSGRKGIAFRGGLVVFQFCISIVLIIGTTIVYKQLAYIQHKKLGYDKDRVLVVEGSYWLGKNQEAYMQNLQQDPRVVSVSGSGYLPAGRSYNNNFMLYPDNKRDQLVKTLRYDVDYNYIKTLGMEMVEGRNFSKEFGTDSTAMIINEETAKAFGWDGNAIGHLLTQSDNEGKESTFHVIGIVKDFHFKSLHERISPLVMVLAHNYDNIIVKTKTRDVKDLLATMKKNWAPLAEAPFIYSFLDERFSNTYKTEEKLEEILGVFAGLTIFVACLGLFGLATFTAEQRTKEIGIRKVLGANVSNIITLLSKDFLKLVFLAFVIASPLAWWTMNKWLQDFAYKINISWWIFGIAALLAITITMITVSFRAIKAALVNPVESLRSE